MLHNMTHTLSPCHINSMDIILISKSRQQLKLNRSMKDKSNNEKKPKSHIIFKKLCEKLSGTRLLLQSICQLAEKLVPKKPVQ